LETFVFYSVKLYKPCRLKKTKRKMCKR